MKIGLVGQSYVQRSLPFNAQRIINGYPVLDQTGKEVSALYGTEGLTLFSSAGIGAHRGSFFASNDRLFMVSGSVLFEVSSTGVITSRGALDSSAGNVSIDQNNIQLGICDGVSVYILNFSTNAFTKVTGTGLPSSVGFLTSLGGFFLALEKGTGRFYISAANNGLAWDALDFATAERDPDNLLCVKRSVGQLFLLGRRSTEIWQQVGSRFPFVPLSSTVIPAGILAPHSAIEVSNSLLWLGQDEYGKGVVYRTQGFQPQAISTEAIQFAISKATNPQNIRGMAYQTDGHVFYWLTGGGLETTLVYDLTTNSWHERAYLNNGRFEPHLGSTLVFAHGKHLLGSRRDGKIYELDRLAYDDDGDVLALERTYTHLGDENKRIRYNALEIAAEQGVGTQTGQGKNPVISLQLSKDGARTWSNWYQATLGKAGEFRAKTVFRRLGMAEQMTFKVRITDPVKRVLIGSYLR